MTKASFPRSVFGESQHEEVAGLGDGQKDADSGSWFDAPLPNAVGSLSSFSPVGETSLGVDPLFEDFHGPAEGSLDDPFETDNPHDDSVVPEDAGVELGIEGPAAKRRIV